VDLVDGYSCTCAPGFSGITNCSVNIDDCASLPCGEGGTCVDGINEYTCQCVSGYILGEIDDVLTCRNLDDCLGNPCTVSMLHTSMQSKISALPSRLTYFSLFLSHACRTELALTVSTITPASALMVLITMEQLAKTKMNVLEIHAM